jgi:hypothetical protein
MDGPDAFARRLLLLHAALPARRLERAAEWLRIVVARGSLLRPDEGSLLGGSVIHLGRRSGRVEEFASGAEPLLGGGVIRAERSRSLKRGGARSNENKKKYAFADFAKFNACSWRRACQVAK